MIRSAMYRKTRLVVPELDVAILTDHLFVGSNVGSGVRWHISSDRILGARTDHILGLWERAGTKTTVQDTIGEVC